MTSETTLRRAAELLDEGLNAKFEDLRLKIYTSTRDRIGMDALEQVGPKPLGTRTLRSGLITLRLADEEAMRVILSAVFPYLVRTRDLVEAILHYLDSEDAETMYAAILKVTRLAAENRKEKT